MKGVEKLVDKSLFNNDWYTRDIPKVKWLTWMLVSSVFFESRLVIPYGVKALILRLFGAHVGSNFIIKPQVKIKFPWKLVVGNRVSLGEAVWIDNLDFVIIRDNVTLSQGAYVCTGNHNYRKTSFDLIVKKIVLEQGVWVGAKSCISPGVKMKEHSILTMNSVLTKDADSFGIYQGNPAVYVKERKLEI